MLGFWFFFFGFFCCFFDLLFCVLVGFGGGVFLGVGWCCLVFMVVFGFCVIVWGVLLIGLVLGLCCGGVCWFCVWVLMFVLIIFFEGGVFCCCLFCVVLAVVCLWVLVFSIG